MFSRDPLAHPEALIRRVYAYAAYRLGDGPDAEDATSDAFERALRYRADLSARQIAELLEARTNTVEVALHRALERLRREISRERSDGPPAAAADGVRV